ncbi:hypothetical protein TrispH2_004010 [Trichoplax sp. H2]|nr:hypothetical protein TrispH2_004010 [Trichoplax sp. H2]|eukprot:RDD43347.1 hypothetical protein TrispH2_004010 [Trichoplax sp. H2]
MAYELWVRLVSYLVVDQIIGAFWYSPLLFGNPWIKIVLRDKEPKPSFMPFFITWMCSLSLGYVLDQWFLSQSQFSACHTATVLAVLIAALDAPHVSFQGYPLTLYIISVGHKVTQIFCCCYLLQYFHGDGSSKLF